MPGLGVAGQGTACCVGRWASEKPALLGSCPWWLCADSSLDPKAEPGPQGQFHSPSCSVAYFSQSHPGIIPRTGCGCRRPHPGAGRPGSCASVCAHSWACLRGGSAWPGHGSLEGPPQRPLQLQPRLTPSLMIKLPFVEAFLCPRIGCCGRRQAGRH